MITAGTTLGPYRIVAPLGAGGMGEVYRARDTDAALRREAASKVVRTDLARDIPVNCFRVDPSINSALKYLRKAPRARKKVEEVYARFVADREARIAPSNM